MQKNLHYSFLTIVYEVHSIASSLSTLQLLLIFPITVFALNNRRPGLYSGRHLCLFLHSSIIPGVRWTPAGSGARQDDAGALSTSSTFILHPIKRLVRH